MTETLDLDDLHFEVVRSDRRRTIGITVERDGELVMRAPTDCPTDRLAAYATEKRFWIFTKLAQKERLHAPRRTPQFVDGEGFHYLGRSHRLRLVDTAPHLPALRLDHGWFELQRDQVNDGPELFRRWYTARLATWAAPRTKPYIERLGLEVPEVAVTDLQFRWGSCSPGRVNLNWKLAQLPPSAIDYVLVHEVAHLVHRHHTPDYWRLVERLQPDFARRKQWLAENGARFS